MEGNIGDINTHSCKSAMEGDIGCIKNLESFSDQLSRQIKQF
jgi:hypothetical protein